MGDISIIARRLENGYVQYGWSGNGGYFRAVGLKLLAWYTDPADVEYLFELGQTGMIGKIGSESIDYGWFYTHELTGEPFWLGRTEQIIFNKIAFTDYGYFYDLDHKWYYIDPGAFQIKIPAYLVYRNLNEYDDEFNFIQAVKDKVLKYILTVYGKTDSEFRHLLDIEGYTPENIIEDIADNKTGLLSVRELYDKYRKIYSYFDDWILIKGNEDNTEISDIIVKKKTEEHIETCDW